MKAESTAANEASTEQAEPASLLLSSWTPHTTRALEQGQGGMAWDVLDHVMEEDGFVDALRAELESTGLLEKLRPARTTADVQMHDMLSLLQKYTSSTEDNSMHDASKTTSRGDVSTFVSRQKRTRPEFIESYPCLGCLIQSVQETVVQKISPSIISIDPSLTSVQLAVYPGDGKSGYARHCDVGKNNECCREETAITAAATATASQVAQRVVTAVYYVTPQDWHSKRDGGCLRLFLNDNKYHDVVPYSNRLVVFRSDCVSHQVMPSSMRERMAITIWLYGTVQSQPKEQSTTVFQPYPSIKTSPQTETAATTSDNDHGPPPLPILENDQARATIFVSIASHCDAELGPTLESLYATAQHPNRISVGVVLQIDTQTNKDEAILNTLPPLFASRVRCLTLDARHSQGPCYARHLCQTLHRDENYVLQIDSHMRFRQNWDTYLVQQYMSLQDEKAMLTAYPVGYTLPNNVPQQVRGTLLVPWKFKNGMLRQQGRLLKDISNQPIPCNLYAAGFNFGSSNILRDCPYDGNLRNLFFGEEISMAVRLYTRGYNLYAPPQSVVYHLWSRAHRPPPLENATNQKHRQASLDAVRQQVLGKGPGLGTLRTAADFAKALGVDFETQSIDPSAKLGGLSPDAFASNHALPLLVAPNDFSNQQQGNKEVSALDPKAKAIIASFLGM